MKMEYKGRGCMGGKGKRIIAQDVQRSMERQMIRRGKTRTGGIKRL
jgi:hypothetical protein